MIQNLSRIWAVVPLLCLLVSGCSQVDPDAAGLVRLSDRSYAYIAFGPSAEDGLGANSGFVVGSQGVLVVDSRLTHSMALELLDAIESVTGAPIRYVVNTHYHPDHTWGNSVFKDEGAVILASPETERDLERFTPIYLEYYRAHNKEAYERIKDVRLTLPDSTIIGRRTIQLGDVEVVLERFESGHTAGDVVVSVPSERIVYAGGLLSQGYHPNLGDPGADLDNWIGILETIHAMKPKYIVPAQGGVCRRGALSDQIDYIQILRRLCTEAIREGMPVEEAAFSITIPGTEGFLQPNILPFNVQTAYRHMLHDIVAPDFEFEMPDGFAVRDGGGDAGTGFLLWRLERGTGFLEIETRWQPTGRKSVIAQDIKDSVERSNRSGNVRNLQIDGTNEVNVGGEKALAVYGTWRYGRETKIRGGGRWIWTMVLRGGKLYSIRLSSQEDNETDSDRTSLDELEPVLATFKPRAF
jgi:glyoxylase-like metal-dependent hydrolase (beta-lactamase superfamily II)